ncbi:hypothetical protein [Nocardia arizonensis]|uniref:hypothetical protein n=1 Tax=Nocardia arizonensis TaxID=1141647 RepID=UPI0006D288F7|nr:hypothetical protein [Nocardia arizonensis]
MTAPPLITESFVLETPARSGDIATARLRPDPDAAIFAGHYPEFAVIPGALLIDISDRLAAVAFGAELAGPRCDIDAAQFRSPLLPRWVIDLRAELGVDGDDTLVRTWFFHESRKAASVRLRYRSGTGVTC